MGQSQKLDWIQKESEKKRIYIMNKRNKIYKGAPKGSVKPEWLLQENVFAIYNTSLYYAWLALVYHARMLLDNHA